MLLSKKQAEPEVLRHEYTLPKITFQQRKERFSNGSPLVVSNNNSRVRFYDSTDFAQQTFHSDPNPVREECDITDHSNVYVVIVNELAELADDKK